jgi:thiamine biosynthesis lipoprotein
VSDAYIHTFASMGTVVSMQVVGHGGDRRQQREREKGVQRAAAWFQRIDEDCTRFDPRSEVSRLSARIGKPVRVSALLYRAVEFALAVADESGGAFDPTVGLEMETRGFNREYRTGQIVHTPLDHDDTISYRDVALDADRRTITLRRPLLLDLGAIAKGLAVDMAARELQEFENFAVDAGGDLFLGGHNAEGTPWSVGIRHPRNRQEMIETLHVSDVAVCTSGDYEQRSSSEESGHHILDPRSRALAFAVASVTVVAPSAMVADALGTAAFVLGAVDGIHLLERHGVDGLIVTPTLERFTTPGMRGDSRTGPGQVTARHDH